MNDTRTWPVVRLALWTWVAVMGAVVALGPLSESQRFLVVGGLAAALVIAVGVVLRVVGLPWPLTALVQVVVLLLWGTVTFARAEATLGFLPNADVLRTWQLMVESTVAHSQAYQAPVPRLAAFESTVAWTVGGVAVLADVIVSGLRRAPLVGLLFLGIYMAPVSVLSGDVGLLAFVPGALGYVFLLVAAQRDEATRWGRELDDIGRSDQGTRRGAGMSAVGQKAGLSAIACAVLVPLLVPTLSPTYFGTGGSGGEGSGTGTVNVSDPTQDLQRNLGEQSNEVLLRMRATGPAPEYVRMAALTDISSDGWAPGNRDGANLTSVNSVLPSAPGQSTGVLTRSGSYDVQVSDQLRTRWLPVSYAPTSVDVPGAWRFDRTTSDIVVRGNGDDDARSDFSYSYSADIPEPTARQMRVAPAPGPTMEEMTELPAGLPRVLVERAAEVTAGEETDFDKAQALQRWFRSTGDFEYDVRTQAGSTFDTLAAFVTDDRRGYCEQFAGAMAIMARAEGIPARVAVGMLRPERDGEDYLFRGTSMHAWPELYFENVGWVRFEPTPGGEGYGAPDFSAQESQSDPTATATESAPTDVPSSQNTRETAGAFADAGTTDDGGPWATILRTTALVLLALLLVGSVPLLVGTLVRRRRWARATTPAERAEAAWGELRASVRDLGVAWDPTLTPRNLGRALGHQMGTDPAPREALDRVVAGVERARYAEHFEGDDLRPDVQTFVDALAVGRSRAIRLRARWLPTAWAARRPSTRRRGRTGGLLSLREQD
ncbi:MAG: DUF3488 and transglutaminase-like domain-containing protein [Nocardioidaceae bacterium]|nr:DUF3488 and transglutaminase-like domain-containing protein [Nocardioidaceae bacterium]